MYLVARCPWEHHMWTKPIKVFADKENAIRFASVLKHKDIEDKYIYEIWEEDHYTTSMYIVETITGEEDDE